ncbi:MAG: alcohol dehydrogenase catalytic domain-containing protein [Deltaproteobacteria bacterium]|nr:alcohol dehydrogenase catalytic domain-containing protein [Deltaproteobacteria bacterium]
MRAVVWDRQLRFLSNYPVPGVQPGWARIRVKTAGICRTDLELTKGYLGFSGVLGHEFIGTVESCEDIRWIGKRVAGEINVACGHCSWCLKGQGRHCPGRTTLGIDRLDGCMADYCILPVSNLIEIPAGISDDRAVFIEPLSAACEILEQLSLNGSQRIVVLGDGRLGILCAWVLSTVVSDVTLIGHHPEKLALSAWNGINTTRDGKYYSGADVVVEATGSATGLAQAMTLCRPRGIIVLKSTIAVSAAVNLSPIVIHELTVLGSRCGRFHHGLTLMEEHPDMPLESLITNRFPIEGAPEAFHQAARNSAIKILLDL